MSRLLVIPSPDVLNVEAWTAHRDELIALGDDVFLGQRAIAEAESTIEMLLEIKPPFLKEPSKPF